MSVISVDFRDHRPSPYDGRPPLSILSPVLPALRQGLAESSRRTGQVLKRHAFGITALATLVLAGWAAKSGFDGLHLGNSINAWFAGLLGQAPSTNELVDPQASTKLAVGGAAAATSMFGLLVEVAQHDQRTEDRAAERRSQRLGHPSDDTLELDMSKGEPLEPHKALPLNGIARWYRHRRHKQAVLQAIVNTWGGELPPATQNTYFATNFFDKHAALDTEYWPYRAQLDPDLSQSFAQPPLVMRGKPNDCLVEA